MNDSDITGIISGDLIEHLSLCVAKNSLLHVVIKLDFNMANILVPVFGGSPIVHLDNAFMREYVSLQWIFLLRQRLLGGPTE